MNTVLTQLRGIDWPIAGTAILLSIFGLVSLYSSSIGLEDFGNFQKQIFFLGIGIVVMFGISMFDYRLLRNDPYFLLILWILGVFALAGLFFLAPEIRGVKSWYKIGGLSVDPIEYVKIVLLVLMAKFFSLRHIEMYRIRHILLSGIYFGIPILLIFFQPDLGSASLLAILWVVLLLISGIKLRHFLVLLAIAAVLFSFGWGVLLQDYQKARIISFVEPELDPLGIGWSQAQSKVAIGNGGLVGQGIGQGSQTQYGFLSEPQTDFVFAAIAEEFGFFGVILLLFMFLVLLYRMFKIGLQAQNNFPRLIVAGFVTLFILQFVVNVGMNLGLLPIIGLSLPLVSYGGSSLLAMYAGLGLLLSIKKHSDY
ncbi:MAG: FtsW/RodA/SpoVE family cell cycle protein [bacterium]|nr:FtsW/RodA/SpoVE family cell cycle protein [bacterium]